MTPEQYRDYLEAGRGPEGRTPEAVCRAKYGYRDPKRAKRNASWWSREYGRAFRVYRCSVCRLWHLTTRREAA